MAEQTFLDGHTCSTMYIVMRKCSRDGALCVLFMFRRASAESRIILSDICFGTKAPGAKQKAKSGLEEWKGKHLDKIMLENVQNSTENNQNYIYIYMGTCKHTC